jgi:hypothetical protein
MSASTHSFPHTHLLHELVDHVLHHHGDTPLLVGVELHTDHVRLAMIPLLAADPVLDVQSLVAPDTWEFAIVSAPSVAVHGLGQRIEVRMALGVGRSGDACVQFEPDMVATPIGDPSGHLVAACHALFADGTPVVP